MQTSFMTLSDVTGQITCRKIVIHITDPGKKGQAFFSKSIYPDLPPAGQPESPPREAR
jgi:hypothetical protein